MTPLSSLSTDPPIRSTDSGQLPAFEMTLLTSRSISTILLTAVNLASRSISNHFSRLSPIDSTPSLKYVGTITITGASYTFASSSEAPPLSPPPWPWPWPVGGVGVMGASNTKPGALPAPPPSSFSSSS
eukprot:CAMPEP_0119489584 /NCGR_PEP_ID=MMETSP1344-20130328/15003_1 /TAXON_ID=236787 /ORGANISM="Florenciella parvula, Strain CCMP2471" /LENGTH=128 /DNA_ID=CAMNT_0007524653 /DNA_START=430 /DNA_END=816 /DNA_ORIENTATION=-